MSYQTIGKFIAALVLGIATARFWSLGEQKIAIFMLATIIFYIFFLIGEKRAEKPLYRFDIKSESPFAAEMKKFKKKTLFKQ